LTTITTKGKREEIVGKCYQCGIIFFRFTTIRKNGGDISAKLANLPGTPWAKYPEEKHLPGYSYCGTGSRLEIRLDDHDHLIQVNIR
jgi:hypothetical protein